MAPGEPEQVGVTFQIVVSGDEIACFRPYGRFQNRIVIGVAANLYGTDKLYQGLGPI
jgi:hypothetical protein